MVGFQTLLNQTVIYWNHFETSMKHYWSIPLSLSYTKLILHRCETLKCVTQWVWIYVDMFRHSFATMITCVLLDRCNEPYI
jgi:hypothetical protein